MPKVTRLLTVALLILVARQSASAWHDTGHMIVAQVAYLKLSPAAKARVDKLLVTPQGRRPLIHLCAGYYTPATCEKIYDPVTIAVWMDDFRGDSINDDYDLWHYINHKPFFDGVPERGGVGPEPVNVLDRINWSINSLRKGTGRDKSDAEVLGFLYHLVGDVHQPLHATTRYTAAQKDGDAGGNGFPVKMPEEARIRNLHSFWDAAAGIFGFDSPKRPLDEAGKARILAAAEEVMRAYPLEANAAAAGDLEPLHWVEESNALGRSVAYKNIKEGDAPSKAYTDEAQRVIRIRLALAGYRLAGVLNKMFDAP
jgi:hypothetical protein